MKRLYILLMLFSFLGGKVSAQQTAQDTGKYRLPIIISGKDTLPVYIVEDTHVEETISQEDLEKQKEWNRMLYDVMKVYPYAVDCANKLKEINDEVAKMDRRKDRREYMKQQEDLVKEQYAKKIENLNPRQGKLLAKLISRQTGQTSYSLIKEYKSGVSAFFWQGIASVYGVSLKDTYDPNQEPQIEAALRYLGYR